MSACLYCLTQSFDMLELSEKMFGTGESFKYQHCRDCKSLQISELPENLNHYYSDQYYTKSNHKNNLMSWVMNKRNKAAFGEFTIIGKILNDWIPAGSFQAIKSLNLSKTDRILDVGCGSGELIKFLQARGFTQSVEIDPFGDERLFANSTFLRRADISDMTGDWELIMLHHTFEHLVNPEQTLTKIGELLGTSGQCLLRLPITDTFAWHTYSTNWIQLDPPRHLSIPSKKGMKKLLERCHFKIEEIIFDSTDFQFWGSEQARDRIPLMSSMSYIHNPTTYLRKRLSYQRFKSHAKTLNINKDGDQAMFIIRNAT